MNAERLAHILLMDARPLSSIAYPVITLNNDGDLIAEVLNCGVWDDQPGGSGQLQREVLVLRVTIPFTRGRFENMRCWNAARGNTPPFAFEKKSRLGLRPSQAELTRVLRTAPC